MAKSAIDRLPAAERERILEMFLAGVPTRKIALEAGVSQPTVVNYKHKRFKPALTLAAEMARNRKPTAADVAAAGDARQLVPKAVETIGITEKLEEIWQRTNRALDAAEGDQPGEFRRLDLMAGLLAQANRTLKLLGDMTGQFAKSSEADAAVVLVVPAPAAPRTAAAPVIDIKPPKRW